MASPDDEMEWSPTQVIDLTNENTDSNLTQQTTQSYPTSIFEQQNTGFEHSNQQDPTHQLPHMVGLTRGAGSTSDRPRTTGPYNVIPQTSTRGSGIKAITSRPDFTSSRLLPRNINTTGAGRPTEKRRSPLFVRGSPAHTYAGIRNGTLSLERFASNFEERQKNLKDRVAESRVTKKTSPPRRPSLFRNTGPSEETPSRAPDSLLARTLAGTPTYRFCPRPYRGRNSEFPPIPTPLPGSQGPRRNHNPFESTAQDFTPAGIDTTRPARQPDWSTRTFAQSLAHNGPGFNPTTFQRGAIDNTFDHSQRETYPEDLTANGPFYPKTEAEKIYYNIAKTHGKVRNFDEFEEGQEGQVSQRGEVDTTVPGAFPDSPYSSPIARPAFRPLNQLYPFYTRNAGNTLIASRSNNFAGSATNMGHANGAEQDGAFNAQNRASTFGEGVVQGGAIAVRQVKRISHVTWVNGSRVVKQSIRVIHQQTVRGCSAGKRRLVEVEHYLSNAIYHTARGLQHLYRLCSIQYAHTFTAIGHRFPAANGTCANFLNGRNLYHNLVSYLPTTLRRQEPSVNTHTHEFLPEYISAEAQIIAKRQEAIKAAERKARKKGLRAARQARIDAGLQRQSESPISDNSFEESFALSEASTTMDSPAQPNGSQASSQITDESRSYNPLEAESQTTPEASSQTSDEASSPPSSERYYHSQSSSDTISPADQTSSVNSKDSNDASIYEAPPVPARLRRTSRDAQLGKSSSGKSTSGTVYNQLSKMYDSDEETEEDDTTPGPKSILRRGQNGRPSQNVNWNINPNTGRLVNKTHVFDVPSSSPTSQTTSEETPSPRSPILLRAPREYVPGKQPSLFEQDTLPSLPAPIPHQEMVELDTLLATASQAFGSDNSEISSVSTHTTSPQPHLASAQRQDTQVQESSNNQTLTDSAQVTSEELRTVEHIDVELASSTSAVIPSNLETSSPPTPAQDNNPASASDVSGASIRSIPSAEPDAMIPASESGSTNAGSEEEMEEEEAPKTPTRQAQPTVVVSSRRVSVRIMDNEDQAMQRMTDLQLSAEIAVAERREQERKEREEEERKEEEARLAKEKEKRSNRRAPTKPFLPPISEEWEAKLARNMATGPTVELAKLTDHNGREQDALTRKAFGTLYPQEKDSASGWLNDEIIESSLSQTVKFARGPRRSAGTPKYHALTSHFFTSLKNRGYEGVKGMARRAKMGGADLLKVDILLVPMNNDLHWTLFVVMPSKRKVEYFDSLNGVPGDHQDLLKAWLGQELGEAWVEGEWEFATGLGPTQKNGQDCGVFVCMTARCVMLGLDPELSYSQGDMKGARKRIACELLAGELEGEFEPSEWGWPGVEEVGRPRSRG